MQDQRGGDIGLAVRDGGRGGQIRGSRDIVGDGGEIVEWMQGGDGG